VKDATKVVLAKDMKKLVAISDRVIQQADGKWTYLSEAQYTEYAKNAARAESVSAASKAPLDELLSVAVATAITSETTAEQARNALAHLSRLQDELAKKCGMPTNGKLAEVGQLASHVTA
jgi:hypothetical protein